MKVSTRNFVRNINFEDTVCFQVTVHIAFFRSKKNIQQGSQDAKKSAKEAGNKKGSKKDGGSDKETRSKESGKETPVYGWRKKENKKKRSKVQEKKKEKAEEKKEVFSARELFSSIGKKQAEKILKDICSANPKWVHVVDNHDRIISHGIDLDLDTLLKGMLLPMDYNKVIREAIRILRPPKQRSRTPSIQVEITPKEEAELPRVNFSSRK